MNGNGSPAQDRKDKIAVSYENYGKPERSTKDTVSSTITLAGTGKTTGFSHLIKRRLSFRAAAYF
jgi:hypothetical protein